MARNHNGQMALYEVLNKERFNAAQKKELARVTQGKAQKAQPIAILPQQPKNADTKQTAWTKKSSMFRLNSGKIEAFMPYPIAVTVVMALALLLVIAFQVGQALGKRSTGIAKSSQATVNLADTAKAAKEMARLAAVPASKRAAVSEGLMPAASTTVVAGERTAESSSAGQAKYAEYVIVLKQLGSSRDLEPARQFFDERGSYFLVTKEKYDSLSPGTPGYAVCEKIKQIGANYKPPEGYNGFAPHMFNDVYGRKM
jgi:hypothetical protein